MIYGRTDIYMRQVDADYILEQFHQDWAPEFTKYIYERIVREAPAVENTATWYKNTRSESDFCNMHYCSNCGNYATHTSIYSHIKKRDLPDIEFITDFCPNCGYRMIEVE